MFGCWFGVFLWNFRDPGWDEMIDIKTHSPKMFRKTQVSVEFSPKKNSVELEVPKMFLGQAFAGSFLGKVSLFQMS